ncbi:MAG: PilW family protein [Halofilum sp. (in: g-proteobacteria)]|nr:PilW family protein [Halofilum sp. (in: g-proteobacteria)]
MDFDGPAIQGTEGGAGSPDSLTIRSATQNLRLNLTQAMPTTSAAIVVEEVTNVVPGDIMIITDCEAADVFQVTNAQSGSSAIVHNTGGGQSPGNATKDFSRSYGPSATTYTAREKDYTIGTTAEGEPALVRTVNGDAQVLVAGVQGMQLTYGVDSDNDETVNVYVQANDVADWDDVLAVRVALLLRSRDDNVVDTTQTYYFPGPDDAQAAPDRRLYQAFNATATIRNRLP